MRNLLLFSLLTCWSISLSAAYEAVFHAEPGNSFSAKRDYGITFLRDGKPHHTLAFGTLKRKPVGFWSDGKKILWIAKPSPNGKEWSLIGFDVENKTEIMNFDIGGQYATSPGFFQIWAEESADQQFMFALAVRKRVWYFESFRLDTKEKIASVKLDKGAIRVHPLVSNRLLAVSTTSSKTTAYLINGETGELLYKKQIRFRNSPKVSVTKSKSHIMLVENEKRELTHKSRNPSLAITRYKANLTLVNAMNGAVTYQDDIGYDLTPFNQHSDNSADYVAARDALKSPGVKVWKIKGDRVSVAASANEDCDPQVVLVREKNHLTTLICKRSAIHFSPEGVQTTPVNLRVRSGFYNADSDTVYVMEQGGSEVGKISLSPLTFAGRSVTGRTDVKIANGLGSALGIALAAYTGYGFIVVQNYSDTALAINHPGTKIYAMNGATRDVTIISTASFEKVAYIPSGEGPMGVATYEQSKYIFSFAINQVNVIDPATDEVRIKLEKGQLVGANGDTDKIYFATEEGLKALRISDLEQVDLLKGQSGIYLVLAPGKDSQALY